ncbi:tRNA pseudouridine(55) synthase TruB [Mesoplasma photuris]|uniref:tRNA pseudouridine(55) synthase TruB n=1 Tax=Mesoplasma photuris TaxID=217731 RepID=UPI0004E1EE06|nr:tRNA pseudouridine(55) synthase TruB [Mesoplasma photuris]
MKSGIIIIDKSQGISTNHVIQKAKRSLGIKKVGHAGTLDPLATGVVVCLVNNGTKISDYLLSSDKQYLVTMKLFTSTDSYDSDGEITETQNPFEISLEEVKNAIKHFDGLNYDQTPPIYSAIKVGGKKLYEYALSGQDVDIKKRNVTIKKLELIDYNVEAGEITLKADCSKGTYIRSLIVDIAEQLNTIAHVVMLRRTKSGQFSIEDATTLDNITEDHIINIHDALVMNHFPLVTLKDVTDVSFGKPITLLDNNEPIVFIQNSDNQVIACYEHVKDNHYKCRRGGLNN